MNYPQALVSLLVFSIFLFVGLPVWWNTTKVYRANLPHERITAAQETTTTIKVNVELFYQDGMKDKLNTFKDIPKVLHAGKSRFDLNFTFSENYANYSDVELYCANGNEKKDAFLTYKFFVLLDALSSDYSYYCIDSLTTVVVHRRWNETAIKQDVLSLLKLYLNVKEISTEMSSGNDYNKRVRQTTNTNMPPAVSYSIVLTLAVADPSENIPSWNIQNAIDQYLKPFLSKFDFLGDIKISSQIVYYVNFKEKPTKIGNQFFYARDKLPLLMNEVQPRLTTYTSTSSTLHFIVYVPPSKYTPLYIKKNKGSNSSSTYSFFSARWGGLLFYNPDKKQDKKHFIIPSETFAKTFVYQLGHLFGLRQSFEHKMFPKNTPVDITAWSRTNLLLCKAQEYLDKSLNTLLSLYKLLGEIENIVISEEIKSLIEGSLENYEKSIKFLSDGLIDAAVQHSKQSFEFSEKAFYDASLLALLYFPDDQKYAIYVPLFVPIAFPVLGSVYRAVSWLKEKSKVD